MPSAKEREHGFDIAIPEVSVTEQRRPFIQEGEERLTHTGVSI